jgi:hypothetical protein
MTRGECAALMRAVAPSIAELTAAAAKELHDEVIERIAHLEEVVTTFQRQIDLIDRRGSPDA